MTLWTIRNEQGQGFRGLVPALRGLGLLADRNLSLIRRDCGIVAASTMKQAGGASEIARAKTLPRLADVADDLSEGAAA